MLVTGDREWSNRELMYNVLAEYLDQDVTLIHGACRGADRMAGEIGHNIGFVVVPVPAEWTRYGRRAAGPIRNKKMVDSHPDLVIAFHNDLEHSKGTRNCVLLAEKAGIPIRYVSEGGGQSV